jgi:cell envelope opacity-associated protein A
LQHDVQAGETLYSIFRKFELPGAELSRLIAIEGPDRPLTRLQSGKSVFILVDTSRRIQRVEVRSLGQVSYRYDRQGKGSPSRNKGARPHPLCRRRPWPPVFLM